MRLIVRHKDMTWIWPQIMTMNRILSYILCLPIYASGSIKLKLGLLACPASQSDEKKNWLKDGGTHSKTGLFSRQKRRSLLVSKIIFWLKKKPDIGQNYFSIEKSKLLFLIEREPIFFLMKNIHISGQKGALFLTEKRALAGALGQFFTRTGTGSTLVR